MANIFINDNLRLNRLGLRAKGFDHRWTELHCQQGRLDGACVVYSVIMALLSLGYISNNDIDVSIDPNPDKRTDKGKLLSRLLDENGLVRDGFFLSTMAKTLREFCPDLIVNYHKKADYFLSTIQDYVENDKSVVINVVNEYMNHGIFVVGTECDNDNNVLKLLCLDPSFSLANTAYWNCIVDVSNPASGEHPYWYITSEIKSKVFIQSVISIEKNNEV